MRTLLPAALAAAVLLAACSSAPADTGGLRSSVEAQGEAQEALRARIVELEDQIELLLSRDQLTELRDLTTSVDGLDTRITTLAGDVDEQLTTAEDAIAELSAGSADLDERLTGVASSLSSLEGSVRQLSAAVDGLGDDLGSLETQFRTHRDDTDAHGG